MLGKYFAHSDASQQVRAEQIRAVAGHMPIVALGTVIAAGVVWFLLHDIVQRDHLDAWAAAIAVLLVVRMFYYRRFSQDAADDHAVLRRGRVLVAMALASGSLWALLPPLFIQGDNAFILISITIILIGMTAGALASESVYMPVFLAYSLPVMISLSTSILFLGDSYDYLGLLGYAFFAEIIGFAVRSGRNQQKSFELRFENLALLEDLGVQKREAEQANQAKSRFLAAASHDLRQPLHALGLYLESLKRELNSERQRELAEKIGTASDSLGELFQCLLDISRLDAGIIEPAIRDFALAPLLQRIDDRFRPQAENQAVELEIEQAAEHARSDPLLLERILDNLVSNALRYTDNGYVRLRVAVTGDDLDIVVEDTGCGIPAAEHESVFEEFHQIGNQQRDRSQGLGLGLAIVKRLCRLLQHRVTLESEPGQGSSFRLRLPRGEAAPMTKATEPSVNHWLRTDANILVIDDENSVREAMQELLRGWGYSANCVASQSEALQQVDAGYLPDLLISDYRLAEASNGVDASRAVFARLGFELPLILITGDTSPERLKQARSEGYSLLHKPVKPAQLRMAINQKISATGLPGQVVQLS